MSLPHWLTPDGAVRRGMSISERIKLAVELEEQALACLSSRPAEAAGFLAEAHRQIGQARLALGKIGHR